jgi:hypothetical protein
MKLAHEMVGACFGDRRLSERLGVLTEQLVNNPDQSFPKATGGGAALEATYRFLNHPSVEPELILAPHYQATGQRCQAARRVVVAHDTSEFRFSTHREGLGRLIGNDHGFLGHFALAVDGDELGGPLGVIGLTTLVRQKKKPGRRHKGRLPMGERESRRWGQLVQEVGERLSAHGEVIHVMDREADSYELLANLIEARHRFIIRMQFDRRVEVEGEEEQTMAQQLPKAVVKLVREVPLSARAASNMPDKAKKHPARPARTATLEIRAMAVHLCRTRHLDSSWPETLTVHVVQVREVAPPAGQQPVEWRLVTTEAIATDQEVAAIVDAYRKRWLIEISHPYCVPSQPPFIHVRAVSPSGRASRA